MGSPRFVSRSSQHNLIQKSGITSPKVVVLSKTPTAHPEIIPHQSLWTKRPDLIAAIAALSTVAIGLVTYAGYKYFSPSTIVAPSVLYASRQLAPLLVNSSLVSFSLYMLFKRGYFFSNTYYV